MGTKFATAIVKGDDSFEKGKEAAQIALAKLGDSKIDLSVVFVSSKYQYSEVVKGIREVTGNAPLIGCSTAGEFTDEKVDKDSIACALISSDTHKFFIGHGEGLREDETKCLEQAVSNFPQNSGSSEYPHRSYILLIDGLSGKGEEVSLLALTKLGSEISIAGGSAGDDYKFKETVTFSNDIVVPNAISATQILSKVAPSIGVEHGHTPISEPFTITKAVDNKVYELDGKPAVEVLIEATREAAKKFGIDVDTMWKNPDQLGKFSLIFEAGLQTGTNYKIRWSGMTADTKEFLPFVCTMPEGAVMRIMESTKESEITSTRNAALFALKNLTGNKLAGAIIFDCACRGAILGDDYNLAIEEIKNVLGNIPIIGFETYGEIALEEGQLSGFHNTTTVVLLFPD